MAKKKKRALAGAAKAAHERRLAKQRRSRAGRKNGVSKRRNGKRRSRRRRRRGNGTRGMNRLRVLGMGALYGAIRKKSGMLEKVPVVESIGATATHAVIAHFAAKYFRSRWLDDMATALAGHCGVNFGLADFSMADFAALEGDDAILGALDAE